MKWYIAATTIWKILRTGHTQTTTQAFATRLHPMWHELVPVWTQGFWYFVKILFFIYICSILHNHSSHSHKGCHSFWHYYNLSWMFCSILNTCVNTFKFTVRFIFGCGCIYLNNCSKRDWPKDRTEINFEDSDFYCGKSLHRDHFETLTIQGWIPNASYFPPCRLNPFI